MLWKRSFYVPNSLFFVINESYYIFFIRCYNFFILIYPPSYGNNIRSLNSTNKKTIYIKKEEHISALLPTTSFFTHSNLAYYDKEIRYIFFIKIYTLLSFAYFKHIPTKTSKIQYVICFNYLMYRIRLQNKLW